MVNVIYKNCGVSLALYWALLVLLGFGAICQAKADEFPLQLKQLEYGKNNEYPQGRHLYLDKDGKGGGKGTWIKGISCLRKDKDYQFSLSSLLHFKIHNFELSDDAVLFSVKSSVLQVLQPGLVIGETQSVQKPKEAGEAQFIYDFITRYCDSTNQQQVSDQQGTSTWQSLPQYNTFSAALTAYCAGDNKCLVTLKKPNVVFTQVSQLELTITGEVSLDDQDNDEYQVRARALLQEYSGQSGERPNQNELSYTLAANIDANQAFSLDFSQLQRAGTYRVELGLYRQNVEIQRWTQPLSLTVAAKASPEIDIKEINGTKLHWQVNNYHQNMQVTINDQPAITDKALQHSKNTRLELSYDLTEFEGELKDITIKVTDNKSDEILAEKNFYYREIKSWLDDWWIAMVITVVIIFMLFFLLGYYLSNRWAKEQSVVTPVSPTTAEPLPSSVMTTKEAKKQNDDSEIKEQELQMLKEIYQHCKKMATEGVKTDATQQQSFVQVIKYSLELSSEKIINHIKDMVATKELELKLTTENATLKSQNKELDGQKNKLEEQQTALEQNNNRIESELEQATASLEQTTQQLSEQQQQNDRLKKEAEDKGEKIDDLTQKLKESTSRYNETALEIETLEEKLKSLSVARAKLLRLTNDAFVQFKQGLEANREIQFPQVYLEYCDELLQKLNSDASNQKFTIDVYNSGPFREMFAALYNIIHWHHWLGLHKAIIAPTYRLWQCLNACMALRGIFIDSLLLPLPTEQKLISATTEDFAADVFFLAEETPLRLQLQQTVALLFKIDVGLGKPADKQLALAPLTEQLASLSSRASISNLCEQKGLNDYGLMSLMKAGYTIAPTNRDNGGKQIPTKFAKIKVI